MKNAEKILKDKQEDFIKSLIDYNKKNGCMISDSLKTELIDNLIRALSIINMAGTYIEDEG